MLAIGLGTDAQRTCRPAARAEHRAGRLARASVRRARRRACRFDLGDFFTGMRGVDWRWDGEKERKVADELGVA